MKNGYSLSIGDHWSILVPIYLKISFFPEPGTITFSGTSAGELLYSVSSTDYHISKDAQDYLMGFCDTYAVAEFSRTVRKNYEMVKRAKDAGYSKIRFICDRKCCEKCKSLDGAEVSVITLLEEFHSNETDFPHEIPCDDTANYCLGPHLLAIEI